MARRTRHCRSYIQDTVRLTIVRLNLDGFVCRTPYFSTIVREDVLIL
jgi:hypothetical protein